MDFTALSMKHIYPVQHNVTSTAGCCYFSYLPYMNDLIRIDVIPPVENPTCWKVPDKSMLLPTKYEFIADNKEPETINIILFSNKTVTLDYVYNNNGSLNFNSSCQKGTITLKYPDCYFTFNYGRVFSIHQLHNTDIDCYIDIQNNIMVFHSSLYQNHQYQDRDHGIILAGETSFIQINKAPQNGYNRTSVPVKVGNSYFFKTQDNHYAKFIVTKIE